MKIVVVGGTGLIGSKLVTKLGEQGHEIVAAAPNTGVDTLTGEGLAPALAGASVVADVSNSPSFEDSAVMRFFETSTRNLLAAEAVAGVAHHVALSVVGFDRARDTVLRIRGEASPTPRPSAARSGLPRCCSSPWRPRMSHRRWGGSRSGRR